MLVIDKRLTQDRVFSTAVQRYLSGDTYAAVETIKRAFPDDPSKIGEALGPYYRKNTGGTRWKKD